MESTEKRVSLGIRQNPLTFYLRALLYMFMALLWRVVALVPLAAALLWIPEGSAFRWVALLTPLIIIFFILPMRFSFAQALVQPARERRFSFDRATGVTGYGAKLGEGIVHALNIVKWGIPLWLMLGACYYFFRETDAITLMKGLEALGAGVVGVLYAIANFFIGIFGGTHLVAAGGLMEGVYAVAAILGVGVLVLLWGTVRNSAFRYIWALAKHNGQRPRAEARRRLTGRRWPQLGVSLINLLLWAPALYVVFTTIRGMLNNLSNTVFNYLATRQLDLPELSSALYPLLFAFLVCYMPLLPVRRILTAFFATKRLRRVAEVPQDAHSAETARPEAPQTAPVYVPAYATPAAQPMTDQPAVPYAAPATEEPEPAYVPYAAPATEEPEPAYVPYAAPVAEEPEPAYVPYAAPVAEEPEPAYVPYAAPVAEEPEPDDVPDAEPEAEEPEPEAIPDVESANPFAAEPVADAAPEVAPSAPGNPFAPVAAADEPAEDAPLFPFAETPADEDDYARPAAPATIDITDAEEEPPVKPDEDK
jgi:hypothetical protein